RRAIAFRVELRRDLLDRLTLLTHRDDSIHQLIITAQRFVARDRANDRVARGGTAPPRDHHLGMLAVSTDMDHDTLHDQADDLLAVGCGGLGCIPKRRQVAGEGQDSSTLVLAGLRWLLLQEAIIFLLKIAPLSQRLLPLSLQAASHQTILGLM